MSKELDALERGIIEFEKNLEDDCNNEWLKRVIAGMKKCYQRLEAIENAKPSEALEELDKVSDYVNDVIDYQENKLNLNFNIIKQALLKAQEQEKVLKILKEKFDIEIFENANGNKAISIYSNTDGYAVVKVISQEEFDLLKRWTNGNSSSNNIDN